MLPEELAEVIVRGALTKDRAPKQQAYLEEAVIMAKNCDHVGNVYDALVEQIGADLHEAGIPISGLASAEQSSLASRFDGDMGQALLDGITLSDAITEKLYRF